MIAAGRPYQPAAEAKMNFVDALMIGGICVMVGACAFLLAHALTAARRGRDLAAAGDHPGRRLDLYMGLFWSGMLLVQATNIMHHMEPGGSYSLPPLTLAATAGALFACGVFAGRLLLRREMAHTRRWMDAAR
jgi:hypothetical protein